MKRIVAVLVLACLAFTSFAQHHFNDTIELNQYIADTIKDRRPDKINADQVRTALLGLSQFLGSGVDVSNLHATASLNYNGTKIIYYNSAGHPLPDSVTLPSSDIYPDGGIIVRDTLTNAFVLAGGRIDSIWVSDDGFWIHNLYMSGFHDSIRLEAVGDGESPGTLGNFPPTTIPYAGLDSILTTDPGGLYYDATDLNVGHNNPSVYSGIIVNGGRASLRAALGGAILNVGSGSTPGTWDAAKHIILQNRGNTYLDIYSVGTGPWVHHADFSTNVGISQSLKVGALTAPDASALVDIESTAKGFLPPRMTTAQRNLISSPAPGLTIYCSDCTATDASTGVTQTYNGSTWKNYW